MAVGRKSPSASSYIFFFVKIIKPNYDDTNLALFMPIKFGRCFILKPHMTLEWN